MKVCTKINIPFAKMLQASHFDIAVIIGLICRDGQPVQSMNLQLIRPTTHGKRLKNQPSRVEGSSSTKFHCIDVLDVEKLPLKTLANSLRIAMCNRYYYGKYLSCDALCKTDKPMTSNLWESQRKAQRSAHTSEPLFGARIGLLRAYNVAHSNFSKISSRYSWSATSNLLK